MKLKNNLTIESQMQEYLLKGFYPNQCPQIRRGLVDNIDVSKYAFIQYDAMFMLLLRELMTFDTTFDTNDYVDNGKFDVERLLSRHMSIAHPHGEITLLSPYTRNHIISHGPYYVIDKGES